MHLHYTVGGRAQAMDMTLQLDMLLRTLAHEQLRLS